MKTVYYYYYLFYKKIIDPDPRLAATLGLTALESFFMIQSLGIVCAKLFCYDFTKYHMIAVTALVLLVNVFYFFTNTKINLILKAKPKFFNNLAIMFKDIEGPPSFDVGFIKTMDIGTIRYYKREWVGETIPIDEPEKDLLHYMDKAIERNTIWEESILKNSEQTEIKLPYGNW